MKTILCAGTFDKFHKGHISFLAQSKKHGDILSVIIARNKSVHKIKGRVPRDSEDIRMENVTNCESVDNVFLGDENDFLRIPKEINPDIVCIGYDQHLPRNIKEVLPNTSFIRMKSFYPEKYKSSLMK